MNKLLYLKIAKLGTTLSLALTTLVSLSLLFNTPDTVYATEPIEENPISIGNAVEIIVTSDVAHTLTTADLDNNGRPDLALAEGNQIRIVANTGTWSSPSTVGSMSADVVDLATADLDRDGRPDLAAIATDLAGDSQVVLCKLWRER